jgi:hypothetical protein
MGQKQEWSKTHSQRQVRMICVADISALSPVTVYLDNRDYSVLSDARRLAEEPESAQALSTLDTLIKARKVVVLWSWVHALEMAPKDNEAIEPAIKRFNAMYRLSRGASFKDMFSIAQIESRFAESPATYNYALGPWIPDANRLGHNLNPADYVSRAASLGFEPTALKSAVSSMGEELKAILTSVREIATRDRNAFDRKENDTNFAQMLFTVFTGASVLPVHAIGCRCAGGTLRRICLSSAETPREIRDSDCADIWHSFYAPYVHVWSGDGNTASIVRKVWPATTIVSGSFSNVVAAVVRKVAAYMQTTGGAIAG